MGLKPTDLENQKSTWAPKENSVCLVKCLIALVSKGIKQAWKGLWRPLELRRNICSQCNTKPSWKEFCPSLFIRVGGLTHFPPKFSQLLFYLCPCASGCWTLHEEWSTVTSITGQAQEVPWEEHSSWQSCEPQSCPDGPQAMHINPLRKQN